ncbi:hypothetical protein [Salinibius halmophilus]|uniref:hypothetical protein n=1 Tax=Salinibius halmophilus TaxID=1853216 RepID=UPI000E6619BA|nr:hypothetical protein [Salinibius halmophilus]
MTNQAAPLLYVRPEALLIKHLIRLYVIAVATTLLVSLFIAYTLNLFILLPMGVLAFIFYKLLPYQHSWFRKPFIHLAEDHFTCPNWQQDTVYYQDVIHVEAMPYHNTNFFLQWFMPYWPGSYRLQVRLNDNTTKVIDLSPVDHRCRLQFYYFLLQRCGLEDEANYI